VCIGGLPQKKITPKRGGVDSLTKGKTAKRGGDSYFGRVGPGARESCSLENRGITSNCRRVGASLLNRRKKMKRAQGNFKREKLSERGGGEIFPEGWRRGRKSHLDKGKSFIAPVSL